MKYISDSNAILTGASKGLGVNIARTLAKEGMNLVLTARSADTLEKEYFRIDHQSAADEAAVHAAGSDAWNKNNPSQSIWNTGLCGEDISKLIRK